MHLALNEDIVFTDSLHTFYRGLLVCIWPPALNSDIHATDLVFACVEQLLDDVHGYVAGGSGDQHDRPRHCCVDE